MTADTDSAIFLLVFSTVNIAGVVESGATASTVLSGGTILVAERPTNGRRAGGGHRKQPIESVVVTTSTRATASRSLFRPLFGLITAIGLVLVAPLAAAAQSTAVIADEVESNGYYVEGGPESDLADAIDRANDLGVAFVRLDQAGGSDAAGRVAGEVWDELDLRGSQYRIVVVLITDGYYIQAPAGFDESNLEQADLAALSGFSTGNDAEGLDAFTSTIAAGISGSSGSATTPTTTGGTTGDGSTGSSGGLGLGNILLGILVLGGGFLLFRSWSGRRKTAQAMREELEADRAEIKEQLRDNADRVIDLGDRVVMSEDEELITAYEQASHTYQDVSHDIDGAKTVEEVDALDDRIDHAEWQFEMIEAKLDGRPVPPSPADVEAEAARQAEQEAALRRAENDKPALGRNESVLAPGPGTTARRPTAPRTSYPAGYGRGRGGFGGGLGGILGSIVLGQMNRPRTRRTQRRSGSVGGGSLSGSLGGGVLRPSGSSRSSGRRGSGRSFGGSGRRRGSGRSF
ncbi:MAG: hypothetical protein OEZ14_06835 [Acidimicrobiia bacterium]|nr:hypothetical protein [Acidimicrobiia bacterium]